MSLVPCLCLLSFACSLLPGGLAQGKCPRPTTFDYGELDDKSIVMTDFPVGTTVTYTCRPGYIRIPGKANSITCLASLKWTVIPQFCDRRDCGPPGDAVNGAFHLPTIEGTDEPDTKFGSTATYTCNPGYRLIGKNTRICGVSGWSNRVPPCEVVICVNPPELTDGTRTDSDKDEFPYQSAVVYSCKPNFSLIGKGTISCTEDGTWSDPAPRCKIVSCSAPDVTNGEKISGFGSGPFKYRETITFQCKKGFSMNGAALVECAENSNWQPPLPTCLAVAASTTPSTTTLNHKPNEKEASTAQTTVDYISKSEASTVQSTKENNRVDEASTVQSTKNNSMEDKDESGGNGGAHLIVGNTALILAMLVMLHSRS